MILYALTATGRALLETALAHRARGGPVSTAARELRVITLGGTVRSLEWHAASVALRPAALVRVVSSLGGSERRRGRGQAGDSPTMTLSTYAHLFEELEGSECRSAADEIRRAKLVHRPRFVPESVDARRRSLSAGVEMMVRCRGSAASTGS